MSEPETDRLKMIETELAYLRKAIEELKEMRTVEIHTHYYNDYSGLADKMISIEDLLKLDEDDETQYGF